MLHYNISDKTNRVLHFVLVAIILILIRIWHLAVIEHDSRMEEARKPRQKALIEPASRATIRDRFNIPLATNKVQYHAAVIYSQMIPPQPSKDEKVQDKVTGVKRNRRKEYITEFSKMIAQELHLDSERLEDLIYSKAALYYQIPFVIKEDISEKEYYRLRMLEKDWPGVHVQRHPKRTYPQGRVASDLIGYMGAINRMQYDSVIQEIKALEHYIEERERGEEPLLPGGLESPHQARNRLRDLQEKAYTINDYVGKTGIEGMFEQQLRGFHGKRGYYSDARGNLLRELPGARDPLSGQRFLLTISSELQEFAEKLLVQNEKVRDTYLSGPNNTKFLAPKCPWMKGGAIVAMDPHNGEILALATYPRFDPNDFILSGSKEINQEKCARILKWLESEEYIADMWNQKRPLEREVYDRKTEAIIDESVMITWERYLEFILAVNSPVKDTLDAIGTIGNAIHLQYHVHRLQEISEYSQVKHLLNMLYATEEHVPFRSQLTNQEKEPITKRWGENAPVIATIRRQLDLYLADVPYHYDKLLIIDLCRLAVSAEQFTPELLEAMGNKSLSNYHDESAACIILMQAARSMSKELFHDLYFKEWRRLHEKNFLKQKRTEEKLRKIYAKPYIDYLDQEENRMFQEFWDKHRWTLILAFLTGNHSLQNLEAGIAENIDPFINYFEEWFIELARGAHQSVAWLQAYETLQKSIQDLPASIAIAYMKTMRGYHDLNRPLIGSPRLSKPTKIFFPSE